MVACDEDRKVVRFGSCKRAPERHDLGVFEGHVGRYLHRAEGRRFTGWTHEKALYSPAFEPARRGALQRRGYLVHDLADFAAWLAPTD